MLEPLKSGRLINHLPFGFSDTEWTDTDQNCFCYFDHGQSIMGPLNYTK